MMSLALGYKLQEVQKAIRRPIVILGSCVVLTLALLAAASQSAARPLLQTELDSYRSAFLQDSIFLRNVVRSRLTAQQAAPQSTITFTNPHLLVLTPKTDMMPLGQVQHLSIRTVFETHRDVINMPPEIRFSAALGPGSKKTARAGIPKVLAIVERVTLWNSVVVDRRTVSQVVVQRPRPAIVVAAPPRSVAEAMRLMGAHKLVAVYSMVATAYTADTAQAYPTGRTATGAIARYGVVAVDPRVIPLGTQLFIERYGWAIAADTGGSIVGNRIDLCMDSYQRAIDWGRRPVRVYVLRSK